MSFLLVFCSAVHLFSSWSYIIGLSFVINDQNDFIYMICFRLNFIEFKKAGKFIKKRKVLNLVTTDIYDRFTILSSLLLVGCENYVDNKINSHNFVNYIWRVFFIVMTEVCFDWMKGIVLLKISGLNPVLYKRFYFELAMFYEKSKRKCFRGLNGAERTANGLECNYSRMLNDAEFTIINSQNTSDYASYLDADNLAAVEVGSNHMSFCILFTSFLIKNFGMGLFTFNVFLVAMCLIMVRSVNSLIVSNLVIEKIEKYDNKNQKLKEKAQQ